MMRFAAARSRMRAAVLLVIAAFATFALADPSSPQLSGPTLRAALLRGGYVLYFRHGALARFWSRAYPRCNRFLAFG